MIKRLFLIVFVICTPHLLWSQGVWTKIEDFAGSARYCAVAFCIGDYGYVGTGYDETSYKNDLWEYNISTNTWTQKADFPGVARSEAVGFAIGNYGYIGTGMSGVKTYCLDFYEYNPSTNTWTQKADFPGTADSSARCGAFAFVINGKGYVGCGITKAGDSNSFFEYDPATDSWTQKQQFPGAARHSASAFAIDSLGYAGIGYYARKFNNDFFEYNPATDTWTQKADFAGDARSDAVGFALGTKGYIGMGYDGFSAFNFYQNDFFKYDPSTDSWTLLTDDIGITGMNACSFVNNNYAYVGLGYDGNRKSSFFRYGLGIITGNIINEPYFLGDTVIVPFTIEEEFLEGNVFTAQISDANGSFSNPIDIGTLNGVNAGNITATIPFEAVGGTKYRIRVVSSNPEINGSNNGKDIRIISNWTKKANFGGGARTDAVGFSIGDKAYIGTGQIGKNVYENDFWEYDEATNQFLQKADFEGVGRYSAVGFSIDAKGYIGLGFSDSEGFKNDFWEYDPTINQWTQKANFAGGARNRAVGFSIGDKGYIGTGYSENGKSDFWEYDPATNQWTQKADFGGGTRIDAVGFSIGTKGYIGTGWDGSFSIDDFWEYDPDENQWTQKANFPGGQRIEAVGFSIGNKGYIGTGWDGYCYNDFWEYDPVAEQWTQRASFAGVARFEAVGFSIRNKGYIGTGYSYHYIGAGYDSSYLTNDIWEYNSHLIVTKPLSDTIYHQGDSVSVPYKVNTAFNTGNIFKAQLSDSNGSFENPVDLDSVQEISSGEIITRIPENIILGDNYRIRVVGTDPFTIGYDNGSDIVIAEATGIQDERESSLSINIVPNPASGFTTFEFSIENEGKAAIEIYTLSGEFIAKVGSNFYAPGQYKLNFDASNLLSGVYNVILSSSLKRASSLMIINK